MKSLKHIYLFTKNNLTQLRRKWLSLPLILLVPIIITGLIAFSIVSIMDVAETDSLTIALVNFDQSEETKLIIELLEESSQVGDVLSMKEMKEPEAKQGITANELSSYVIFPEYFFQKLMDGQSSQLSIIGNPERPLQSQIINELIETLTRHIRSSQANILTINHYAKQLGINDEERNALLLEQFTDYFFYVLGSDKVVSEEQITNNATSSPTEYFSLAGWFTIVTIWLFIIYSMLQKDSSAKMKERVHLYGVTDLQQAAATIVTTLFVTAMMATATFFLYLFFFDDITITTENGFRIACLLICHNMMVLQCFTIIEWLLKSQKGKLLIQSLFTAIVILFSGAIIPKIYFPVYLENFFSYSFAHQSFYWIEQIMLNGRFYAEFMGLTMTVVIGWIVLIIMSSWKGRVYK
ncbi:ABC transporter permease [Gracilibacillus caseinilyticus]|uniref:ABC transporter permease n=1 Tax=Gracilibacillus caseinilyticus TaxID=2932256 RepID=A0ABY4F269_9BACI|nr:ABC transporter permease [Gracilibacillus caseinilyticus]UOQ49964.1 ABC transporter permease [Gracilibacillus caseinilyticus]